ncbi:MAG: NfeD family protein [Ignavibacteriales bacterium]|nr:NfeD family protein [Ignavibacteriales bacterium]
MFDSISNELLWFLCGLIFLLSELVIPGFVIFFFGIGAWIVALLLWMNVDMSFTTQLFIFLLSSVVSLVLFRRFGKNYYQAKVKKDDAQKFDDIRGEKATVLRDITPNGVEGKVEFHGTVWNAESDVPIAKGAVVEVVEQNNLTLKVKPASGG